ncbi:MAG: hypothetical protein KAS77_11790, partial [Thermoplasmata archaeon]|nr:hypothetical protein [Thermoplasmata archaeon]
YKKAIKNRNACIKKLDEISRSFAEEPSAPGTTVAPEGQDWSAEAHFEEFAEAGEPGVEQPPDGMTAPAQPGDFNNMYQ